MTSEAEVPPAESPTDVIGQGIARFEKLKAAMASEVALFEAAGDPDGKISATREEMARCDLGIAKLQELIA